MIKEALQSIQGVEIYPIISLLLFVLSFGVVLFLALRMNRSEVEYVSRLPLDDGPTGKHYNRQAGCRSQNTGA